MADLAARLAPVLGHEVVYEVTAGRCARGHYRLSYVPDAAACPVCGTPVTWDPLRPKDWLHPGLLWPLWERWNATRDYVIEIWPAEGGAYLAEMWETGDDRRDLNEWARGLTATEAVARAWLRVLGEEAEDNG
ncbi:MAG: hypothetical protein K6V97_04065 [Actinomycetia bacterium]|nr:hypothetical protein [Actinomycetes bacterium]